MSHILSHASCAPDPAVPFFSRETVAHAVKTVVDGFLEMCITLLVVIHFILFFLMLLFLDLLC